MSFNVHRRNRSLGGQVNHSHHKEGRSLKKMNSHLPLESVFSQAKQIYQAQGDLQEAIRLFSQFLAVNCRHNEALYLCGVSELKMGQVEKALSHFFEIGDEYHNKPNAMLLAAMALNKLGRVAESLEIVNDCINRFQGFEEAICFRGKLYLSLKYYHRAEIDFKSLASNPDASFLAHHSLGDCYRAQGKPDKAIGPYIRAIELLGKQEGTEGLLKEMSLKLGICLYQIERFQESLKFLDEAGKGEGEKCCEYYYYLGCCELKLEKREEGLLHLEYCLRVQGNPHLMKKAYKQLLEGYLKNYQFYEALNVVKLGDICKIRPEGWGNVVQAFMLIIKANYEEGVAILTNLTNDIKKTENTRKERESKIKRGQSQPKPRYHDTNELRRGLVLGSPKSNKRQIKPRYFSTKSVSKVVPKIESTRVRTKIAIKTKQDQARVQTQYVQRDQITQIYQARQKEFMYPLVLLFKAYAQFFTNNYFACLDTYDEYQNFIKDLFGRESDVSYNKALCQGLLMAENDMHDDALAKYGNCIDIYFQKLQSIPIEPLLYKIVLMAKMALLHDQAQKNDILEQTLDFMHNYQGSIGEHSLSLYFRGLICYLLGRTQESKEWLDKGLKTAEDCSWKWLWIKGAIELELGHYYQAVKEFSAGLILQSNSQLYLGRSIAFLLMSTQKKGTGEKTIKTAKMNKSLGLREQEKKGYQYKQSNRAKSDILVQNSFEDLQKYIEMATDQQQISLWVSKILFSNGAYDQAIRSINKLTNKTPEIDQMCECIAIYEGDFEEGGLAGALIQNAFQGRYLTPHQETKLASEGFTRQEDPSILFDKDYQKWLVLLHFYVREQYHMMLKVLQRQLFGCQDSITQSLLRYNVAIVYLLMNEKSKAVNALRSLSKDKEKGVVIDIMEKLQEVRFDQDECLPDLRAQFAINCSKLLSNYLPYKSIYLNEVRIFLRPSIPFPDFSKPSLELPITIDFIMEELNINSVEKKIQAPWIKRTKKKTVQFTQKLEESGIELDLDTGPLKEPRPGEIIFD